jgi:hypothetical protein
MAVPGLDPRIRPGCRDQEKRRAFRIRITGTKPVMTMSGPEGAGA